MNKQKNWYNCYSVPAGNVQDNSRPGYILYPVSKRRVNKICSSQYSKTNVMHFLFSLLRIKILYVFRVLLAYLQEALHKRHLVYCMRVMSAGCTMVGVHLQQWCNQLTTHTKDTKCRLCIAF
jgi:hypothetical protein